MITNHFLFWYSPTSRFALPHTRLLRKGLLKIEQEIAYENERFFCFSQSDFAFSPRLCLILFASTSDDNFHFIVIRRRAAAAAPAAAPAPAPATGLSLLSCSCPFLLHSSFLFYLFFLSNFLSVCIGSPRVPASSLTTFQKCISLY